MGRMKDEDRWSTTHLAGEKNGSYSSNKYGQKKKKKKAEVALVGEDTNLFGILQNMKGATCSVLLLAEKGQR